MVTNKRFMLSVMAVAFLIMIAYISHVLFGAPSPAASERSPRVRGRDGGNDTSIPLRLSDNKAVQERLSMQWYDPVRDFAWAETLGGNSVLEAEEIAIILRAVERRQKRGGASEEVEESFWKLLVSMPLNLDNATNELRGKLVDRAQRKSEILQAQLFLSFYAKQSQPQGVANRTLRLAEEIRAGKVPEISNPLIKAELPYVLFCDAADTPTASVLKKIIRSDELFIPFVIDVCSLSPKHPISTDILAKAAFSCGHRSARIALCNLIARKSPENGEEILAQIQETVPYKMVGGRKLIAVDTGQTDRHSGVYSATKNAQTRLDLASGYHRAKKRGTVADFMAQPPKKGFMLIEEKAWWIYRYAPETFNELLIKYGQSNKVAGADRRTCYLRYLLVEVLRLNALVLSSKINVQGVRDLAYDSKSAARTVNGLFLLKAVVGPKDVGNLSDLARDPNIIRWQNQANGTQNSAPLIAMWAIYCLEEISSPGSREALKEIAADEKVPARARERAKKSLP